MHKLNRTGITRILCLKKDNMRRIVPILMLAAALGTAVAGQAIAQARAPMTDSDKAKRWAVENELASLAAIERKLMIPMRDNVRIATDVYHPKDSSKTYPAIWVRTPYNFNYWDVANGVPRDMTMALTAIKHGYAFVEMQERGQFFSEGE
jgi:predicted acyl esterase